MMKKFISAVAAVAMVMAFVGCGPIDFSVHTETISNANYKKTAYYITDVEVMSGADYLDATIAMGKNGHDGNVVTLTSKAAGDAIVKFTSSVSAKTALVPVTVYSSGMISSLSKLEYTTFNGDSNHNSTVWEDATTQFDNTLENGYYSNPSNTKEYLLVNNNVLCRLIYESSVADATYPDKEISWYYWARGVVTKSSTADKVSIHWDTWGRAQENTVHNIVADKETHTYSTITSKVTGLPTSDENEIAYFSGSSESPKTVTFGSSVYKKMSATDFEDDMAWPTSWKNYSY